MNVEALQEISILPFLSLFSAYEAFYSVCCRFSCSGSDPALANICRKINGKGGTLQ